MLTRCQRGGELQAASETADYARRLDLQDRYLNSKCSLYFLRADKPKEAEDCMLLFTKVRPPRQLQLSLNAHYVRYRRTGGRPNHQPVRNAVHVVRARVRTEVSRLWRVL